MLNPDKMKKDGQSQTLIVSREREEMRIVGWAHIRNALILLLQTHIHTKWRRFSLRTNHRNVHWALRHQSLEGHLISTESCSLVALKKKGGKASERDRERTILNGKWRELGENIFYCYIFFPINWMSPAPPLARWLALALISLCSIFMFAISLLPCVIFTLPTLSLSPCASGRNWRASSWRNERSSKHFFFAEHLCYSSPRGFFHHFWCDLSRPAGCFRWSADFICSRPNEHFLTYLMCVGTACNDEGDFRQREEEDLRQLKTLFFLISISSHYILSWFNLNFSPHYRRWALLSFRLWDRWRH